MKRNPIGTMALGIALAALLAAPRPVLARGHDRGWATAGKILTGMVILGAISQAVQPPPAYSYETERTVYVERPVYVDRTVYVERPAPVVQAPTVIYDGVDYVETPVITYETRYYQGRRMEGCPRVYTRSRHVPREIVIPHGHGRRLYQPGIRGHEAFVQEWSPHSKTWRVIGGHPSIWR